MRNFLNYKLILGSSSFWRKKTLTELGYTFETMSPDIDEKAIRLADPKELVLALGKAKAAALLSKINEPAILITSDQVGVYNGEIREKPENKEQVFEFFKSYELAPIETFTSVVVSNTKTGEQLFDVDIAKVYFKPISDEIINQLLEQGNVFSWAGGFAIDDPLLEPLVEKIEGSKTSVNGLPAELLEKLLNEIKL